MVFAISRKKIEKSSIVIEKIATITNLHILKIFLIPFFVLLLTIIFQDFFLRFLRWKTLPNIDKTWTNPKMSNF
jgi:hypothetical protein